MACLRRADSARCRGAHPRAACAITRALASRNARCTEAPAMRPGPFSLALVLVLAMSPVAAMANELPSGPPPPMSPDPTPAPARDKWYGGPILAADLASAAMWGLAYGSATSGGSASHGYAIPLAVLASAAYVIPSPIVHALHGHGWRAVGGVALRLALPTAGMFVGGGVGVATCKPANDPSGHNDCGLDGFFTGVLAGGVVTVLGAMAIDDAVLAWEPPDVPTPAQAGFPWLPPLGV